MATIYTSRADRLRRINTKMTGRAYLDEMRDILTDGALGDDLYNSDDCDDCCAVPLITAVVDCLDNWHSHN